MSRGGILESVAEPAMKGRERLLPLQGSAVYGLHHFGAAECTADLCEGKGTGRAALLERKTADVD